MLSVLKKIIPSEVQSVNLPAAGTPTPSLGVSSPSSKGTVCVNSLPKVGHSYGLYIYLLLGMTVSKLLCTSIIMLIKFQPHVQERVSGLLACTVPAVIVPNNHC